MVNLPPQGHQVVLGTAGTGKSTMAMLRADHLAAPTTRNSGRVLLVTYNRALIAYLRHLLPSASANITIETYGRFARGYLNSRGQMPRWGGIATPSQRRMFIHQALAEVGPRHPRSGVLQREMAFFLDELGWIASMGIRTLTEYQAARRYGRETGLNERQRERVWEVYVAYRNYRQAGGPLYDWFDLATSVREALATDSGPRLYRHIIIDEGQDLSPEAVRSLVEAADPEGSVTFFGDYHQAIYGQGLSWRACGLNIRQVERFQDNLRNTAEIAALAIAMAKSDAMVGEVEDLVEPLQPNAAGAKPTLAACRGRAHEIEVVQAQARNFAGGGSVAVLARTWQDAQRATRGLPTRKLNPDLAEWDGAPGIYIGAYHSGKGLEFDAVIMPFLGADTVPHPDVVDAFGEDEAASREAKLLYVGITRAKSDLLMTYSGKLTPLLPQDPHLYVEVIP
ncbi:3'-5' exonuclease [Geodermatophilus sp. SYSU D00691]